MHGTRRILWVACCAACLFLPPLEPDGGIAFVAPLIVLTFPAGMFGDLVFGVLYEHFRTRWGWDVAPTILSKWSYFGLYGRLSSRVAIYNGSSFCPGSQGDGIRLAGK
jgi:hypothetical protein